MVKDKHCNNYDYSRCIKEAGIEYYEMEKYKWNLSEKKGYDVGREAFIKWANEYSCDLQRFLKNLSDEEVNRRFKKLPKRIKKRLNTKLNRVVNS